MVCLPATFVFLSALDVIGVFYETREVGANFTHPDPTSFSKDFSEIFRMTSANGKFQFVPRDRVFFSLVI